MGLELWTDLQEVFYFLYAPFIVAFVLPIYVGTGVLLVVLMAIQKFWRPREHLDVTIMERDRD